MSSRASFVDAAQDLLHAWLRADDLDRKVGDVRAVQDDRGRDRDHAVDVGAQPPRDVDGRGETDDAGRHLAKNFPFRFG